MTGVVIFDTIGDNIAFRGVIDTSIAGRGRLFPGTFLSFVHNAIDTDRATIMIR